MRSALRKLFECVDVCLNAAFSPAANPMFQLGAMGWFFYWIVVGSGIYLYIFFDTGVTEAYESIQALTESQWYAGGIMRSLHRYASDALVVVALLHVLREFAADRLHGARTFTWITGVALLWFIYASGITGYWIVWDMFAQYVAIATAEWLDALPIFAEPIARNFLHDATLSGRFFTLFVFIHIVVPLIMLFFMWLHIQRLSQPAVNPPRRLALGTLAGMLALSLLYPATSQGPAVLTQVPAIVGMDWFYFFLYPLLDRYSGSALWAVVAGGTALLVLLPWLARSRQAPLRVARVDLPNCNGCGRCVADCPFGAITLQPRSDGLPYGTEAVVDPDLCVSCGLCVGACPTATPFRRRSKIIPGIELPDFPMAKLREDMIRVMAGIEGSARVLVVACTKGNSALTVQGDGFGMVSMPCVAMLPPSFIDFALSRRHADGVLLSGCADNDCFHRLGQRWTRMRIEAERDPALRARVPRDRVAINQQDTVGGTLNRQVLAFQQRLANYTDPGQGGNRTCVN